MKTYWPFLHFIQLTLSATSVACGRATLSHNSLAPPPHAGHISLWGGIPFLNQELLKVNQLIPQVFNLVEVWTPIGCHTPVTDTHLAALEAPNKCEYQQENVAGDFGTLFWGVTHMFRCVAHSTNA